MSIDIGIFAFQFGSKPKLILHTDPPPHHPTHTHLPV